MCKSLTTAFQRSFQTPRCKAFDQSGKAIETYYDIMVSCTEVAETNATFLVVAKQIVENTQSKEMSSVGEIINQPITIYYESVGGSNANDIDWWELVILILKKTFPSQPYP